MIVVGLLLFHPVGWLIMGGIWFLAQANKGINAEVEALGEEPKASPAKPSA